MKNLLALSLHSTWLDIGNNGSTEPRNAEFVKPIHFIIYLFAVTVKLVEPSAGKINTNIFCVILVLPSANKIDA